MAPFDIEALLTAASDAAGAVGLVVELPKHELVKHFVALTHAVRRLRKHGVAVALDDFGDGRSSLRLWSELKPRIVKIDKCFSAQLRHHPDKAADPACAAPDLADPGLVPRGQRHRDRRQTAPRARSRYPVRARPGARPLCTPTRAKPARAGAGRDPEQGPRDPPRAPPRRDATLDADLTDVLTSRTSATSRKASSSPKAAAAAAWAAANCSCAR
jgi:hypothetical protein